MDQPVIFMSPVRIRGPGALQINIGTGACRAMWGYGVDPPADMNPHLSDGSAAGRSQISQRSAGLARRRPAGSWTIPWLVVALCADAHTSRGLLPGVVVRSRNPDISRVAAPAGGSRGPCVVGQTLDGPVIFLGAWRLFTEDGRPSKSRRKRFNEPLPPPLRPEQGTHADHPTPYMSADPVRYMSVHSRKQPDSHGHSGTSQPQKQQPARPGIPSSRAVSAGSGRCWVRTNVG